MMVDSLFFCIFIIDDLSSPYEGAINTPMPFRIKYTNSTFIAEFKNVHNEFSLNA